MNTFVTSSQKKIAWLLSHESSVLVAILYVLGQIEDFSRSFEVHCIFAHKIHNVWRLHASLSWGMACKYTWQSIWSLTFHHLKNSNSCTGMNSQVEIVKKGILMWQLMDIKMVPSSIQVFWSWKAPRGETQKHQHHFSQSIYLKVGIFYFVMVIIVRSLNLITNSNGVPGNK